MNTKLISGLRSGILTFNLSDNKPCDDQHKHIEMPGATCGTAGATNALVTAESDHFIEHDKKILLADIITLKLKTAEAWKYLYSLVGTKTNLNPWNAAECIVWAVNALAKKTICEMQYGRSLQEIVYNIVIKKSPNVIGGSFTSFGHFVATVGIQTTQTDIVQIKRPSDVKIESILAMIIDDGNGDYNSQYKSRNGNDTPLTVDVYKRVAMRGKDHAAIQSYWPKGIKPKP